MQHDLNFLAGRREFAARRQSNFEFERRHKGIDADRVEQSAPGLSKAVEDAARDDGCENSATGGPGSSASDYQGSKDANDYSDGGADFAHADPGDQLPGQRDARDGLLDSGLRREISANQPAGSAPANPAPIRKIKFNIRLMFRMSQRKCATAV